jgi:uncharacterized tellurite resistance protein B-like protein
VAALDSVASDRARYLAAFAYVLSRVAGSDLYISDPETEKMIDIIRQRSDLPDGQVVLIVQIATSQNRLLGGTENFLVTREFRQISTPRQRYDLLECLFAVSAADRSISAAEEAQIRQIASELRIEPQHYVRTRLAYARGRAIFGDSVMPG